jgi:plastocyanin
MRRISFLAACWLVFVASGCGGGGQRLVDAAVFAEAGDTFGPREVVVDPDAQIAWTNVDSEPHTVTPDVAGDGPDSAAPFPNGIGPGQTFYWRVPAAATTGTRYFYHCRFHGQPGNGQGFGAGMVGVVRVR